MSSHVGTLLRAQQARQANAVAAHTGDPFYRDQVALSAAFDSYVIQQWQASIKMHAWTALQACPAALASNSQVSRGLSYYDHT